MRMPRAKPVLIGIAAFLVLTAGVGAVAGPYLPESQWDVPGPRIGDHGLYTAAMFDEDGVVMDERPYLRFTWDGPGVQYEFDGTAHWTNTLHAEQAIQGRYGDGPLEWVTLSTTYHLDAASGAVIATNRTQAESIDQDGERTIVNMQSSSAHLGPERQDKPFQCGLISPVQGTTISLRGPVRLHGDCTVPFGVIWTPASFDYTAVAIEEIRGDPAVRFRGEHAPDEFVVDYWYQDLPYPVKIATYLPNGTTAVTTLREFQSGDEPLSTIDDAPPLEPLPPLEFAARRPWGLDDSGIDHPFKASTAWTFARNDPDWPGLRESLAKDPGLMAHRAFFSESRTIDGDTESSYAWQFHVASDPPLAFTVRDVPHEPERDAFTGLGLPEPDPPERDRYVEVHDLEYYRDPGDSMPPTDVELPTVASLWAQWQHQRGDRYADLPPNSWGLHLHMEGDWLDDTADAGADLSITTRGAQVSTADRLQGEEDEPVTHEQLTSTLSIRLPRSPMYQSRSLSETWQGHGPAIEAPPARPVAAWAPEALDIAPWNVPPLPWWVGTGVVAVLVAGIAWTWPIVKPGLWGLFSRHSDREEVLADPVRRRVLDTVKECPGIHLRALADAMELSRSAILHHARKLESFRLVRIRKEGQYLAFYAAGSTPRPQARSAGAQAVLEALADGPLDARQTAERAGLSLSTTYHHIGKLTQSGLLAKEGRLLRRLTPSH